MSTKLQLLFGPTRGPRSILLVRLAVSLIFFTQGILKYIDPNMGVVRFTRIGFPHPYFTAHFVGTFEVLCGLLLFLGLWTRLVSIPLLIVITTAIATTKIPELFRTNQGFWYMVSDARTDFATLVIGGYTHFLTAGSDNVFRMPPGALRLPFQISAVLLALLESLGCFVALRTFAAARAKHAAS